MLYDFAFACDHPGNCQEYVIHAGQSCHSTTRRTLPDVVEPSLIRASTSRASSACSGESSCRFGPCPTFGGHVPQTTGHRINTIKAFSLLFGCRQELQSVNNPSRLTEGQNAMHFGRRHR